MLSTQTSTLQPFKYRVLVADDDHDTVDSTAMLFQLQGHDTRVAYDGWDALSQAIAFRPDVVLLDIAMPRMDGYDVARALRNIPASANPLLVAVTGFAERTDKRRCAEAGFDLHLTKPVDYELFEQTILLWRQSDAVRELALRHTTAVRTFLSLKLEMAGALLDVADVTRNPATQQRCLQQVRLAHELMTKWIRKGNGDLLEFEAAVEALRRRYARVLATETIS